MKQLLAAFLLAFTAVAPAGADDIGLVTVKNSYQAKVLGELLGHAYVRIEQKYLTSVSEEQMAALAKAGIEYETVFTDADPSSTYLIYPPRKRGNLDQAPSGSKEIGLGLRVSRSQPPEGPGHGKFAALDELSVEFLFVSPAIEGFLSSLADYPSDTLAYRVDVDSIYAFDTCLEAFQTRYIWTDSIDRARDWMVQTLLDWGYTDVTTPQFQYDGAWHYNVMAVKPGWAEPDKVIVVGGHYDSITYGVPPGPLVYAPGADDNASGTVTMLEMARILADIPLRKTVIFMAFSAEEVGLVGSYAAAHDFWLAGTDLEVMFNYDMVAFDPYDDWRVDLSSAYNTAYRQISYDAATRVTPLSPRIVSMGGSSDHFSFVQHGYDIVDAIETNFNDDGWHTNLDVSSRLNFDYFSDVVRMAVASVGIVADAAHPTEIEQIIDQGDGQSVEVFWTDCHPEYSYTINYGTASGYYPYSVSVPSGLCSYVIDGLTEGMMYYFSVVGEVEGAYPPAWAGEDSSQSFVVPRTPENISIEPELRQIGLVWSPNREADFSHYRVYRDAGSGLTLFADNLTDTGFVDTDVEALVEYIYQVSAVDLDLYESALTDPVSAMAYTFDQGILLVDETADDPYLPNQAAQEAFFDSAFAGIPFALDTVGGTIDTLQRQKAGPYSSIIWLDDDVSHKDIAYNENGIEWYTGYPTDMFIGGWQTITRWEDSPITTGHVLYEEFGVRSYDQNDVNDFVGGIGQNGWPSVTMDTDNLWKGKFPFIPALEGRAGTTVIYTYDSFTDNPQFEGKPCGFIYESDHGKRIIIAFPVWWLTPASSQALMARVAAEFGEGPAYVYGDADGSGQFDILDIDFLIDYLYRGGPAPTNMDAADADSSCQFDILDVDYMVDYLYRGGLPPGPGCVQ
ncbi:MAG: M20/M25/M40 family metallo-hydrolase [Candidatus Zixiibacteriota bacterium]|nr:MAG: M20/M25/M40 family metallo-hydrolase [candidate division Zixibacteria bacterium]